MPASTEPRSGLLYGWDLGENNWNAEMDSNLISIGRFAFHLSVLNRSLSTPPASPSTGDTYIVANSPTNDWAGRQNSIAVWDGSAWQFGDPRLGWVAYIEDEEVLSVFKSGGWSSGVSI